MGTDLSNVALDCFAPPPEGGGIVGTTGAVPTAPKVQSPRDGTTCLLAMTTELTDEEN